MWSRTETSSSSASTSEELPEILRLGAFELAAKIRERKFSSEEVVDAHIERARAVDPRLNAIAEERFGDALRDARAADERIKKETDLPPLLGVPMTVKEMLAYEGFKSTGGSVHRRDRRPGFDATVVKRMKDAGAIPIATTNVPELGFWFETDNTLYGRTNNPYDAGRTAGGSSGGEGALIGAGASPFGLGSDIGGSIRMPAAFCGIFGHKPTNRSLPLTGHFPYELDALKDIPEERAPYTTTGMLARKAADLRPLMELLMGPDGHDPRVRKDFKLGSPVKDPAKFRVFTCEAPVMHLLRPVDRETREATRNAARLFEQLGAPIAPVDPRLFVRGAELWGAAVSATRESTFENAMNPGGPLPVARELAKAAFGRAEHTIPGLLTVVVERLRGDSRETAADLAELSSLRRRLDDMLGDDGILLLPCHPRTAPRHRATWFSPFDFAMTAIFNAIGVPATAVPMGLSADGLPLSVQVVAGTGKDHLCFSAAEILDSSFGGWRPPAP